jgi:hypothetical protein
VSILNQFRRFFLALCGATMMSFGAFLGGVLGAMTVGHFPLWNNLVWAFLFSEIGFCALFYFFPGQMLNVFPSWILKKLLKLTGEGSQ